MTSPSVHAHIHADARHQKMAWFLEAHFGTVEQHSEPPVLIVRVDGKEARVSSASANLKLCTVSCENERLRGRVESVVEMAELTVRSLDEYVG